MLLHDVIHHLHHHQTVTHVIWTPTGRWYQSDPTSGKYYAMKLKDKVRAASSGGQYPYFIEKVVLRRLIADIAFA